MTEELEKYLVERIKYLECRLAETESSLIQNGQYNFEAGYQKGFAEAKVRDKSDYVVFVRFLAEHSHIELTCINGKYELCVGKERIKIDSDMVARAIADVLNDFE